MDIKLAKIHAKLREKERQGGIEKLRRSLLKSDQSNSFYKDEEVQIEIEQDVHRKSKFKIGKSPR